MVFIYTWTCLSVSSLKLTGIEQETYESIEDSSELFPAPYMTIRQSSDRMVGKNIILSAYRSLRLQCKLTFLYLKYLSSFKFTGRWQPPPGNSVQHFYS